MSEMIQLTKEDGSVLFIDSAFIGIAEQSTDEEDIFKLTLKTGAPIDVESFMVRHTAEEMRLFLRATRLALPAETAAQSQKHPTPPAFVGEEGAGANHDDAAGMAIPDYQGPKLYFGVKPISGKDSYLLTITEDKEGHKKASSEDLIGIIHGELRNALGPGDFDIGIREGVHYLANWSAVEDSVMHFKLCGWEENDLNEVKAVVLV